MVLSLWGPVTFQSMLNFRGVVYSSALLGSIFWLTAICLGMTYLGAEKRPRIMQNEEVFADLFYRSGKVRHMILYLCIRIYIYIPETHVVYVFPPKEGLLQSKEGSFRFLVYIYIISNIQYIYMLYLSTCMAYYPAWRETTQMVNVGLTDMHSEHLDSLLINFHN